MSEDLVRRRAPSPAQVAMRSERLLMTQIRRQIGALQQRAAFLEARTKSMRPISIEERAAEVGSIREAMTAAQDEITQP